MPPLRSFVQLSVESLIAHAVCNYQHALSNHQRTSNYIQGVSNLIVSISRFNLRAKCAIKHG